MVKKKPKKEDAKRNIMELNVKERLDIRGLYPRESDIITQTLVKDIDKKVMLTQNEQKKIEFKLEDKMFKWNQKKAKMACINVEFSDAEINFLKEQAERMNKEKKITQENLDLIIKIKNIELN